jgi:hypothetical protein
VRRRGLLFFGVICQGRRCGSKAECVNMENVPPRRVRRR